MNKWRKLPACVPEKSCFSRKLEAYATGKSQVVYRTAEMGRAGRVNDNGPSNKMARPLRCQVWVMRVRDARMRPK